jgi:hypothetical protein
MPDGTALAMLSARFKHTASYAVLLAIHYRQQRDFQHNPQAITVREFASVTGHSKSEVQRALKELETREIITITRGRGHKVTSVYGVAYPGRWKEPPSTRRRVQKGGQRAGRSSTTERVQASTHRWVQKPRVSVPTAKIKSAAPLKNPLIEKLRRDVRREALLADPVMPGDINHVVTVTRKTRSGTHGVAKQARGPASDASSQRGKAWSVEVTPVSSEESPSQVTEHADEADWLRPDLLNLLASGPLARRAVVEQMWLAVHAGWAFRAVRRRTGEDDSARIERGRRLVLNRTLDWYVRDGLVRVLPGAMIELHGHTSTIGPDNDDAGRDHSHEWPEGPDGEPCYAWLSEERWDRVRSQLPRVSPFNLRNGLVKMSAIGSRLTFWFQYTAHLQKAMGDAPPLRELVRQELGADVVVELMAMSEIYQIEPVAGCPSPAAQLAEIAGWMPAAE